MKNYEFEVWFTNGTYPPFRVHIIAGCLEHAEILARADRIRAGLDDTVSAVRQLD